MNLSPGKVALLGSGETSLAGGRIFESLAREYDDPLKIALLETPAGFELNSAQVAGRVGDFLRTRLQNFNPVIHVIPARKKGTAFSPDDPMILSPLADADIIFMGPGSPTYAVRHLQESLAWDLIRARHRLGSSLVFASAATISIGAYVLPVYEIFKAGEDVFSIKGLDLFSDFNLYLSFVPHWNNGDGGGDLDTSRCFIGMERFDQWCHSLPKENLTIGLDEHTGLLLDFQACKCTVNGISSVTLLRDCSQEIYPAGQEFPLSHLGEFSLPDSVEEGLDPQVSKIISTLEPVAQPQVISERVKELHQAREKARQENQWEQADDLRAQIDSLGWTIQDTAEGSRVIRKGEEKRLDA